MPRSPLFSAAIHCFQTAVGVFLDFASLPVLAARSHTTLIAENLFLRKQLALFQERKTRPRRADDGTRWVMATLSRFFPWRGALGQREAGYLDPLASPRIPPVLALEIQTGGKTTATPGPPATDPQNGGRECDLGRGTHRRRTEAKAGNPGVAADGGEIPTAGRPEAGARSSATMADIHPESRQGDRGVRLLRRRHGHFPNSVRVRDYGGGDAANPPQQCDRSSHGGLDSAAVPRGTPRRPCLPIRTARPGQHLLEGTRPRGDRYGRADSTHAGPGAEGERDL